VLFVIRSNVDECLGNKLELLRLLYNKKDLTSHLLSMILKLDLAVQISVIISAQFKYAVKFQEQRLFCTHSFPSY